MQISITKRFTFEAAHQLNHHDGPCARRHGHSYKLEVTVRGNLLQRGPKQGMVMDFADLKYLVEREVILYFDHQDLNTMLGGNGTDMIDDYGAPVPTLLELTGSQETTAENLAIWMFKRIYQRLLFIEGDRVLLTRVRLWETESGWVTVDA